jgi:hypothetical protein
LQQADDSAFTVNNVNQAVSGLGASDPLDNRRKRIIFPTQNRRFYRFFPTAGDVGATVYKLGSVGVWQTLVTMAPNFTLPFSREFDDEFEGLKYDTGAQQLNLAPPLRLVLGLNAKFKQTDATAMANALQLTRYPLSSPVLLYENAGVTTSMYHVRRLQAAQVQIDQSGITSVEGLTFKEAA